MGSRKPVENSSHNYWQKLGVRINCFRYSAQAANRRWKTWPPEFMTIEIEFRLMSRARKIKLASITHLIQKAEALNATIDSELKEFQRLPRTVQDEAANRVPKKARINNKAEAKRGLDTVTRLWHTGNSSEKSNADEL